MNVEHFERGYYLVKIRKALLQSGFKELACWGSFREMSPVKPALDRVWFVVKKEV